MGVGFTAKQAARTLFVTGGTMFALGLLWTAADGLYPNVGPERFFDRIKDLALVVLIVGGLGAIGLSPLVAVLLPSASTTPDEVRPRAIERVVVLGLLGAIVLFVLFADRLSLSAELTLQPLIVPAMLVIGILGVTRMARGDGEQVVPKPSGAEDVPATRGRPSPTRWVAYGGMACVVLGLAGLHPGLPGIGLVLLLATLILWPIEALVRRSRQRRP